MAGETGSADGVGSAARFNHPVGIAVAPGDLLYVTDPGSHTVRRISPDGTVTTIAGAAGVPGSVDGVGAAARFNGPVGLAADDDGYVYVADSLNATVRKISPTGAVTTLAGAPGLFGSADGTGSAARFSRFFGVDVDASGTVYVADTNNVTIRKVTPSGAVSTIAGSPGDSTPLDGVGRAARFDYPYKLAVDDNGTVYVADGDSTIRRITTGGAVTTPIGSANTPGCLDAIGSAARLNAPQDIDVGADGALYIVDTGNSVIRRARPG